MGEPVDRFKQLRVYEAAFDVATTVFRASKAWPQEEQYALTDQVRRSSRSVCANIAEAWAKRLYPRSFVSKLSDAHAEAAETIVWIDFAEDAGYLDEAMASQLRDACRHVSGGLVKMIRHPEKWCGPASVREAPAPYTAGAFLDLDDTDDR